MSLRGLLCQKAALYTRRQVSGSNGVVSYVYNKIADGIKCRSVHLKDQFGTTVGAMAAQATHMLYLDIDSMVVSTNMFVNVDGTMYQFEHVDPKYGRSGIHHYECMMFAVESPQTTSVANPSARV
jgi:hypothetical protein